MGRSQVPSSSDVCGHDHEDPPGQVEHRRPGWPALLLAPGVLLLRRLPLWAKVGVVASVLVLPLTPSLIAAGSDAREAAAATRDELAGTPAVVAVSRLMHGLTLCDRADAAPGRLRELVAAVDGALPPSLRTEASSQWLLARPRLVGQDPGRPLACPPLSTRYTVAHQLGDVLDALADQHRLSLDPGRETYYLQLTLTDSLPRLRVALLDLARTSTRPAAAQADQAAVGAATLVADAAAHVKRSLDRVEEAHEAPVPGAGAALVAWSRDLLLRAEALAEGRPLARETSAPSLAAGARLAAAVERLAGAHLVRHLEDRLAAERSALVRPALGAVTAVLLMLYLLVALAWSLSRELGRIHRGLRQALSDVEPTPPARTGGDELAGVAAAVEVARREIGRLVVRLRDAAARHESLVRHASDVTLVTDDRTAVTYVSPALREVLGIEPDSWADRKLADLVVPDDRDAVTAAVATVLARGGRGEVGARIRRPDGVVRHLSARLNDARRDPMVGGILWNLRDVSRETELAERLHYRAYHDELTGLGNRALFMDRLAEELRRVDEGTGSLAVCILDLDRLKETNDRLGHAGGDALLRAVAQRFRAAVRNDDLVCRLGGDEFGVLVRDPDDGVVESVAERLGSCLDQPVSLAGILVQSSVSIGITLVCSPGSTADRCMEEADTAMYRAKKSGGRAQVFDAGMLREDPRTAGLEIDELLAEPDALAVVWQPICELGRGDVVGYEALTRFPGREHRTVEEWFRLARDTGRATALEMAALRRVLDAPRPEHGYLSVNLSPQALQSASVRALLAEACGDLVVEVTEHDEMDEEMVTELVSPLQEQGLRVAVDDTGAGYANLRQLVRLRPDIVKLDRTLVSDVHRHPEKRALVEAMVSFCRRTGAQLCAEGVEVEEELVTLSDLGVALGQGWLLGRPARSFAEVPPGVRTALGGASRAWGALDLTPVLSRVAASADVFDLGGSMRSLLRTTSIDDVSLSLVVDGRMDVVTQHDWATSDSVFLLEDYPTSARVLCTGELLGLRVDDPTADPDEVRLLRSIGYNALLKVPVSDGEEPLALVELYSLEARDWSPEERAAMREVANAVAAALRRIRADHPDPGQGSRASSSATVSPERTAPSM